MSSVYARGKSLWIAYKDERGIRVCRPSGYKVGEEGAAEAVAAELDRKAKAVHGPRPATEVLPTTNAAVPTPLEKRPCSSSRLRSRCCRLRCRR